MNYEVLTYMHGDWPQGTVIYQSQAELVAGPTANAIKRAAAVKELCDRGVLRETEAPPTVKLPDDLEFDKVDTGDVPVAVKEEIARLKLELKRVETERDRQKKTNDELASKGEIVTKQLGDHVTETEQLRKALAAAEKKAEEHAKKK